MPKLLGVAVATFALVCCAAFAQAPEKQVKQEEPDDPVPTQMEHMLWQTQKHVDDLLWYHKVGDVAEIDKVRIVSTKPIRLKNPTAQGAGNPLIIWAYTFIPKKLAKNQKAPMIVFVHGGVHADFTSNSSAHIVRELMELGYIVVAPEYRGSTGYGKQFYDQIDYGGAEIDDTHSARDWAVANLPQVDGTRVGIIGWSHGGYHVLLNLARWPKDYQVGFAGVPVSDLVMRMGYKGQGYNKEFAGFIGKLAVDDPMEYRRRSPVFHAKEIETPLLIHSNTNDEDVNVMEVQHMVAALKAEGKKFEYKIYDNVPGAHQFNRIDTPLARESRREIYGFMGRYLKP
ncbi:MAG TPA: alpha/beta fold hydrolase [Candidatus Nanoarchaeia archaeon]|nr:alpha/beta fold hydrolase [Candidatus Nanoarchaeia archaeon]